MASSSMSGGGRRQPASLFPWLVPQPRPEPEPEVTSVTPMVNIVSSNPPPAQQTPVNRPPATASPPSAQQTPVNRPPATTRPQPILVPPDLLDINPDTVGSRAGEYDSRTALEILTDPGDEHRFGQVQTFKVLTGTSLDDETQEIAKELAHILKAVDPLVFSAIEPWYTTRLEQAPSTGLSTIPNAYSDMAFAYGQGILQPGRRSSYDISAEDPDSLSLTQDRTTQSVTNDDERWYRNPLPELSHPIQQALASIFDDWNPELASRAYLQNFLTERMAPFIREDALAAIPWDDLTTLGMVYYYHSLIETAHTENWNLDTARDPWVIRLDNEAFLANELLSDVTETPLENEARLLQEFDYASVEEARNNLLAQVQYAYETFDIQPPEDLHEWSVLELANEYHSLLSNVYLPYRNSESNTENFYAADDFVHGFSIVNFTVLSPEETRARLDGSHQEPNLDLVFFVASIFIEPLDWVMTGEQMIRAAEEEDWWLFALSGVLLLLPFASGKLAKGLSKSDEAVDVARVSRRAPAASGSNLIKQADGRFARPGYPAPKDLKKQLEYVAEYDPSQAWRAPDPGTKQQAHHMVPKGMKQSKEARDILEEKGISLHSYHNGVALEKHVHDLMAPGGDRGKDYANSVNAAILSLQHAPREEIEIFLEDLALRFSKLNAPDVDYSTRFQTDIMDWLATFK